MENTKALLDGIMESCKYLHKTNQSCDMENKTKLLNVIILETIETKKNHRFFKTKSRF